MPKNTSVNVIEKSLKQHQNWSKKSRMKERERIQVKNRNHKADQNKLDEQKELTFLFPPTPWVYYLKN